MSGSFWKFGQDYSNESSLANLLNNAFIKIESKDIGHDGGESIHNTRGEDDTDVDVQKNESDSARNKHVELPDTEAGFKDYEPNLDILCDLLDEEELYTELMCSNFKLII